MAAFTDYFENKVIDHMLRNQAFTPPATLYFALFTTATDDTGGGTEVTGGSYARQPVTLSAAAGGASSNTGVVTFTNMPGVTITHGALMDALTGGNMLMHGALGVAKVVTAGSSESFAVGDIDVAVE